MAHVHDAQILPPGSRPGAAEADLAAVRRLAQLLDSAITVPGTNFRIGLDGLLGLVPGIGDLVGTGLSVWILLVARRLGVSNPVLVKMAGNVLLDAAIGAVPILGDLFDFVFKANQRNLALLESHLQSPAQTQRSGRRFLIVAIAILVLLAAGVLALLALVLSRLL